MKITKVIEQAKAGFWGVDSGRLRPLQDDILSHTCRSPLGSAVCQGVHPFGNPLFTSNKLPVNN